jgi:hypothetical protein
VEAARAVVRRGTPECEGDEDEQDRQIGRSDPQGPVAEVPAHARESFPADDGGCEWSIQKEPREGEEENDAERQVRHDQAQEPDVNRIAVGG